MINGNDRAARFAEGFVASDEAARWTYVGTLTFANAGAVCAAAALLPLPGAGVIDCSGLTAVDSAAVAVLLSIKRRAANESVPLVFENVPASLRALATVYGVDEILVAQEPFASV